MDVYLKSLDAHDCGGVNFDGSGFDYHSFDPTLKPRLAGFE